MQQKNPGLDLDQLMSNLLEKAIVAKTNSENPEFNDTLKNQVMGKLVRQDVNKNLKIPPMSAQGLFY